MCRSWWRITSEMMKFRNLRAKAGSRSLLRESLEPRDLLGFARRVGGGQAVLRLEDADRLGVLEPLGQREDEDGVQPVDRLAVVAQQVGGAADGVGAGHWIASGLGWRNTMSQG